MEKQVLDFYSRPTPYSSSLVLPGMVTPWTAAPAVTSYCKSLGQMSGVEEEPAASWLFPVSFTSTVLRLPSLARLEPALQFSLQEVLGGHPKPDQWSLHLPWLHRGHKAQALLCCAPRVELRIPER